MFYKVYATKPETRIGRFGLLQPSINYMLLDEDDLNDVLKTADTTALNLFDMDDNKFIVEDGKLVKADSDEKPISLMSPSTPVPLFTTENAPNVDANTGKPVVEDTAPVENVATVKPVAPVAPVEDAPVVEHHDDMTPGEKIKLAEDRAAS